MPAASRQIQHNKTAMPIIMAETPVLFFVLLFSFKPSSVAKGTLSYFVHVKVRLRNARKVMEDKKSEGGFHHPSPYISPP
jgi:hypothetical protein